MWYGWRAGVGGGCAGEAICPERLVEVPKPRAKCSGRELAFFAGGRRPGRATQLGLGEGSRHQETETHRDKRWSSNSQPGTSASARTSAQQVTDLLELIAHSRYPQPNPKLPPASATSSSSPSGPTPSSASTACLSACHSGPLAAPGSEPETNAQFGHR